MKAAQKVLFAATGLFALAGIGVFTAPRLSAAVKAALVEIVIPSKPFNDHLDLVGAARGVVGPGTGTLGITSIIIGNFDSARQQVFIFSPVLAGSSCSSGVIGGGSPSFSVLVPAGQSVQYTFPTPLVFAGQGGPVCMAAEVTTSHTGGVTVDVNGFVN